MSAVVYESIVIEIFPYGSFDVSSVVKMKQSLMRMKKVQL